MSRKYGIVIASELAVRMGEGAGSQAALGALVQGQEDIVIMPAIFAASAIQKGMPIKIIALYHPKTPVAQVRALVRPPNIILRSQYFTGAVAENKRGLVRRFLWSHAVRRVDDVL